jgi:hypothetical protein
VTAVVRDGRVWWLGRNHTAQKDERDGEYQAFRVAGPRRSIRWLRRGPALSQRYGSCTGHSLAGWLNTHPGGGADGRFYTDEDAEQFYSWGTRVDGIRGVWPPDDTGSTGKAVCKGARNHRAIAGWTHAFGIDHALDALQLGPVMVGTLWLDGMFTPDHQGVVRPTGDVAGGHEYLADEYIADPGVVGFQNSWSGDWGVDGRFYMTVSDFAALLDDGGDVTVPMPWVHS